MHTLQRRTSALAVVALLLTTAGCAGASPSLGGTSPSLPDRTFLSVAASDGGVAKTLVAGTRITLAFQNGSLSVSVGCNSMGGAYHLDGGRLVVDQMSTTDMGCEPDLMAQDTWLAAFLGSRPTVNLAGDELTLEAGSVVIRLRDRKIVEPDVAITAGTWTVESIISGDAVSSVPAGVTATLAFHADGKLDVSDGCNQGSARWKAVGTGMEVSDLVLTKKACEAAGGRLEAAVVGVLRASSIAASIDGNVLTLRTGAGGLQLRAS